MAAQTIDHEATNEHGNMALTERDIWVSIVTPSFNQADFLNFCLTSISTERSQGNLEHLVLDGGSSDSSVDIIKTHASSLDYWRSEPDGGQSDAINAGMSRARGTILTWINSDDGLAPGAAAAMRAALGKLDEPAWAIGQCLIVDEAGQHVDTWRPTRHDSLDHVLNWRTNYIMQPAVFWNRALWERSGPLDALRHYAMDFDLWIRFFEIARPILVDQPIGIHRFHGQSKTSLVRHEIFDEYLSIIEHRLKNDRRRRHVGLQNVARAMCDRANVEVFYGNNRLSLRLLRKALHTSASSAAAHATFWKAIIKLSLRIAPSKIARWLI
jgi:glycosyltransferase involved in cell wall biosynthesis